MSVSRKPTQNTTTPGAPIRDRRWIPRSSRIDGSSSLSVAAVGRDECYGLVARRFLHHRPERTHATMPRWADAERRDPRLVGRPGAVARRRAPALPSAAASCSMRPASGGSSRDARSGGSTPTRRCSSAGCGRCCCSRCTRWRWPASPSTATTGTTRGVGCSAPPTSSPRPRSVRPPRPSGRSGSSAACTSTSSASPPTAGRTRPTIRTCCVGCTSPRSTASSPPTRTTAIDPLEGSDRDEYVAADGIRRAHARRAGAARVGARAARPAPFLPVGAAGHARGPRGRAVPARAAADAARRPAGVPRCSAPPRWRCCRGGRALPLRLPYLPIAERVALRPAGEAVTRTLRWALARRPTAAEPD